VAERWRSFTAPASSASAAAVQAQEHVVMVMGKWKLVCIQVCIVNLHKCESEILSSPDLLR